MRSFFQHADDQHVFRSVPNFLKWKQLTLKDHLKNEAAVCPRNMTLCSWGKTLLSFLWETFMIRPRMQAVQASGMQELLELTSSSQLL